VRDPLSLFLHEKVAVDNVPSTASAPRISISKPDPKSPDPGERALAGAAAVGGSLTAKLLPWGLSAVADSMQDVGSVPWHNAIPVQGGKSIADVMADAKMPRSKLLGLFDITSRIRPARSVRDHEQVAKAINKLQEIQPVVDSFIDKHNLAEKGVTLNFNRGALGSAMKNRYVVPSKEVFFSSIDKEKVLHELGHAADFTGSRLGKIRGWAGPAISRGVSVALPIALVAGDRIKEMMPGTIDDKAIEYMQNHAPEIMAATLAATTLYPEAKASYLAVQHIAKTEGPEAARAALKKLVPAWGTYLIGAIPAVVGMALARKYMREAREEKNMAKEGGVRDAIRNFGLGARDLAKGVGSGVWHGIVDSALDIAHVGKEVGRQAVDMIKQPQTLKRISAAAKEVGTSPEFVQGALSSAIPATMAALYLYGTPGGKTIRERVEPSEIAAGDYPLAKQTSERWREQHPLRFAGLVAAGAALSGGIISKFFSDLQRVI